LVELGFEGSQRRFEPLIRLGALVEREHINVEEQIVAEERVLDLQEEAADTPVARSGRFPRLPVDEQRLDGLVDDVAASSPTAASRASSAARAVASWARCFSRGS
jgi:hypothetical protein